MQQQVRELRIVDRGRTWSVEYGYWTHTGQQRRFIALCEWTAANQTAAREMKKKLEINVLLDPEHLPPPDAPPIQRHVSAVRRLAGQQQRDSRALIGKALRDLPEELPSVEELHGLLDLQAPSRKLAGWQFYLYLNDAPYRRLLALCLAAGTTRAGFIEALLYAVAAQDGLDTQDCAVEDPCSPPPNAAD